MYQVIYGTMASDAQRDQFDRVGICSTDSADREG
jgi:hypothetical protein